ncbi:sperm-associated antigen 1-like isoform X1 [Tripterygium wilfordii]|uniref:Sperm-associated antigen 1-like isoform X1 n=1 Tax=Tripterygium wilfordii TaxID=458696 RepID=A0A7J7CKH2_TRIWF|nr:small glutamine-rich tetratricopeptide repeat-containing protein alpha [Tripterygium wilfordii]XP_038724822.1 small glutamine-rich tetratricopeptide repeat-containing protein alpha [Tripterygium wilfordii]KAF5734511.1 sperm-associated antigen 1-like isoform X1 [Tripterygium wilfordii]
MASLTFVPIIVAASHHLSSTQCSQIDEIRVCTNRTCRRQGSMQILETLTGLAPPNVSVNRSGCLGRCGAGPNLALLPDGVTIGHCGTAARAAEIMAGFCYGDGGADAAMKSLDALSLRKRAEGKILNGDFSDAELLLCQATELNPVGGLHIIYKDRSIVRLAMGNHSGALDDARQALALAHQYTEAYICEGDALLAMYQFDAAEKSYSTCLQIDPSIGRSKPFKARMAKLQEKLTAVNSPGNYPM